MTAALFVALGLGIVAGLRAFTALAGLAFERGGVPAGLGILLALVEDVMDVLPSTPSRTAPRGLIVRFLSGGFCGWAVTAAGGTGAGIAGAVAGIVGAAGGTYGGHAARVWAIGKIGNVPSGILEDAIAIALVAFVLTR